MPATPADWFPDPFGRHESRYWDGQDWTQHVADGGVAEVDPPVPSAVSSFTGSVLSVKRTGVFARRNRYVVRDQNARIVGGLREIAVRSTHGPGLDPAGRTVLQLTDASGHLLLTCSRRLTLVRSTILVHDPQGLELGRVRQKNVGLLGDVRFALESERSLVGTMTVQGRSAANIVITNEEGRELARTVRRQTVWGSPRADVEVRIGRLPAAHDRLVVAAALVSATGWDGHRPVRETTRGDSGE